MTKTLFFNAKAKASTGTFFSGTWVHVEEVSERLRSWPTAPVRLVETLDCSGTTAGGKITNCAVLFDGTIGAVECVILP